MPDSMLSDTELLIASCPSTEEGLKLFCVNISHHVPLDCWHLTGPSITYSHAFHPHSTIPGKEPVMMAWQLTQQYCVCHNHVNPQRNNSNLFFSSGPHTDKSVSHVRRVGDTLHVQGNWSWGRCRPGSACHWPQ